MIVGGGGGAAAAAAAQNRQLREEMIVEQSQREVRLQVGHEILSHVQGNLPAVPQTPEEALERAQLLNSPEILLQDPMNSAIVSVIEHITARKHSEFEQRRDQQKRETEESKNPIGRFLSGVIQSMDPDEGREPRSTGCAKIKEILKFFPALEHDLVVARLQILEGAHLIDYFYSSDYDGRPSYSPRVWTRESKEESHGFTISSQLREFRRLAGSLSSGAH